GGCRKGRRCHSKSYRRRHIKEAEERAPFRLPQEMPGVRFPPRAARRGSELFLRERRMPPAGAGEDRALGVARRHGYQRSGGGDRRSTRDRRVRPYRGRPLPAPPAKEGGRRIGGVGGKERPKPFEWHRTEQAEAVCPRPLRARHPPYRGDGGLGSRRALSIDRRPQKSDPEGARRSA